MGLGKKIFSISIKSLPDSNFSGTESSHEFYGRNLNNTLPESLPLSAGNSQDFAFCENDETRPGLENATQPYSVSRAKSEEGDAVMKPHQSNSAKWEAVKTLRTESGNLGFGHFEFLQKLGTGDIGTVYLASLKGSESGYLFAIKAMSKSRLSARNKLLRLQTERQILESLDHPFLPTLYGHFETKSHCFLIMDFCSGGDLHSLRMKQLGKRFDENETRFYAAEVLLALEYLHMMGVIYRDLKPENVLICEDGHIMLTDFDLSLKCDVSPSLMRSKKANQLNMGSIQTYMCMSPGRVASSEANSVRLQISSQNQLLPDLVAEPRGARSMSFVGTYEYLAPEIVSGEGHGSAVDWWALGIFMYELLYGRTPFKGISHELTLLNATIQQPNFPAEVGGISENAKGIMKALLAKDPIKRLGFRRGAAEIKQHPFFAGINWPLIRCTPPPHLPKQFQIKKCWGDPGFELF